MGPDGRVHFIPADGDSNNRDSGAGTNDAATDPRDRDANNDRIPPMPEIPGDAVAASQSIERDPQTGALVVRASYSNAAGQTFQWNQTTGQWVLTQ